MTDQTLFEGVEGELIVGQDGRWLGDFAANYVVPSDSTLFSLEYPVGWTNCGWYETVGCNTAKPPFGCRCVDCCHGNGGLDAIESNGYTQRHPDDLLDECQTKTALDGWQYAIAPKRCAEGCATARLAGRCCCTLPCDTIRCTPTGAGKETAVGWPLTVFGAVNPSLRIRVVTDTSGPTDLESMNALEIDFSGSGNEGATFVGEGGGFDTSRPPYANSNPSPTGIGSVTNARSANFWNVEIGDCVRLTCWVKAVPDMFGNTCVGYPFNAKITSPGQNLLIPPTFSPPIRLTDDWQLLDCTYTNFAAGFANYVIYDPMISLITQFRNSTDAVTVCADDDVFRARHVPVPQPTQPPRGRVHVKAVHLAPCVPVPRDVHVWRRH